MDNQLLCDFLPSCNLTVFTECRLYARRMGNKVRSLCYTTSILVDFFGSFSVKIQLLSFTWIIGKLPEGAVKILARGSVVFFFRMGCIYHCVASVLFFLVGCFVLCICDGPVRMPV